MGARVFDAGARRTTAGAAVLPKTKMGPLVPIIDPLRWFKVDLQ